MESVFREKPNVLLGGKVVAIGEVDSLDTVPGEITRFFIRGPFGRLYMITGRSLIISQVDKVPEVKHG